MIRNLVCFNNCFQITALRGGVRKQKFDLSFLQNQLFITSLMYIYNNDISVEKKIKVGLESNRVNKMTKIANPLTNQLF